MGSERWEVRGEARAKGLDRALVACWAVVALGVQFGVTAPILAQTSSIDEPVVLRFPSSIRSAGFNGAGVALVGNAGAVFFNPAALATIRHVALEVALQSGPFAGELAAMAVGWKIRQFDIGFGLH